MNDMLAQNVMWQPATDVIPGLGEDFFIDPSCVDAKGGGHKQIPGLGRSLYIPTACVKAGGTASKYLPGLGKTWWIDPNHVK